jgi:hypothetical protein
MVHKLWKVEWKYLAGVEIDAGEGWKDQLD